MRDTGSFVRAGVLTLAGLGATAACGRGGFELELGCDAATCARTHASCAELRRACPCAPSGVYWLSADASDPAAAFEAYCDMDIDEGGWTLVGRSWPGAGVGFGWRTEAGSVHDTQSAYSLNAVARGLRFSQLLLGDYASGLSWGSNAYRFDVPPDFLETYEFSGYNVFASTQTILGDCFPLTDPEPPVWMMQWTGWTYHTDCFSFRDANVDEIWGLNPGGFRTAALMHNECFRNGMFTGRQGMLMVR